MPDIRPPALPGSPRRRALLGGALALPALAVSGCSTGRTGAASVPDPDAGVRRRSIQRTEALLARYGATLAAHPELTAVLAPLRAELTAHARAFGARGPSGSAWASPSAGAEGSASATPAAGPPATAPGHPVPGATATRGSTRRAALTALAEAERTTARARGGDLLAASPPLARLIASVAACNAGHAQILSQNAGGASDDAAASR